MIRYNWIDLLWPVCFLLALLGYFYDTDINKTIWFVAMALLALATMFVVGLLKHSVHKIQGHNDDKVSPKGDE